MKKLLLIFALFLFLSCEITEDPLSPLFCYSMVLKINSATGEILSNEVLSDFVYERQSIDKWKADEGIHIKKDTINHIITINTVICILSDRKEN